MVERPGCIGRPVPPHLRLRSRKATTATAAPIFSSQAVNYAFTDASHRAASGQGKSVYAVNLNDETTEGHKLKRYWAPARRSAPLEFQPLSRDFHVHESPPVLSS